MKFTRIWAMPNKNTFEIKCIRDFIGRYHNAKIISIDPFANRNKIAKITNDLDTQYNTDYNLDALDFLKLFDDNSVDLILFDPPYTPRQVAECYKKLNKTVNMETTQSSFWSKMKDEISRITKSNGYVLSFGWNSNGVGKKRNFELKEILLVAHGTNHNDTICIAEQKINTLF
jgi:site-specific DNA-adenine methylase